MDVPKALRYALLPFSLCLLLGCQTTAPRSDERFTVENVVKALKRDVDEAQHFMTWASLQPALNNACRGKVEFQLVSAKVTLTASAGTTSGVSAGVEVPIGGVITAGPSISSNRQALNTQAMTFYVYPVRSLTKAEKRAVAAAAELEKMKPDQLESRASKVKDYRAAIEALTPPPPLDATQYPITEGLRTLRTGLLAASDTTACLTMAPDPDDGKTVNTLEYGFAIEAKDASKVDISFLVFSLGVGGGSQTTAANAVAVSFKALGTTMLLADN